jgi:hypothetical protein
VLPVIDVQSLDHPDISPYNPKAQQHTRNITFYFSGSVCSGKQKPDKCVHTPDFNNTLIRYSGGVRAKVRWGPVGQVARPLVCCVSHGVAVS